MIHVGTLDRARERRIPYTIDGALLSHKSVLIGPVEPDPTHPNAFLIEQEPLRLLPVHFHGYGQFQVVVAGSGRLGTHPLRPLTVHYAGQRTPYGPIVPDADGLWYLTLRPRTEGAAFFMPESRGLRDPARIPRFDAVGPFLEAAGRDAPVAATSVSVEAAMAPGDHGLAAWLVRIPAGASTRAPARDEGAGRFHVVVGGSLLHGERELPWLGTVWTDADDAALDLRAGARGAEVLVLQFPSNACEHPHPDPQRRPATTIVSGAGRG